MGEISFKFEAVAEPKQEVAFQYAYANSKEYGFTYERCIALSNASILNSPVSIIKVATGLSALYPLFIDKTAHGSIYYKSLSEIDKIDDDVFDGIEKEAGVDREPYLLDPVNDIVNAENRFYPYSFSEKSEYILTNANKFRFNLFEAYNAARFDNTLILSENVLWLNKKFALKGITKEMILEKITGIDLLIYKGLIVSQQTLKLNIESSYRLERELSPGKPQEDINLSAIHEKFFNIHDVYAIAPFKIKGNILKYKSLKQKGLYINPAVNVPEVSRDNPKVNAFKSFMVTPEHEITVNIFKSLLGSKAQQMGYVFKELFCSRQVKKADLSKRLSLEKIKSESELNQIVYAITPNKNTQFIKTLSVKSKNKNARLNIAYSFLLPNKNTNIDDINSCMTSEKEVQVYQTLEANKTIKSVIDLEWLSGSYDIKQINSSGLCDDKSITVKDKRALKPKSIVFYKFNNKMQKQDVDNMLKQDSTASIYHSGLFGLNDKKTIGLFKDISLSGEGKSVRILKEAGVTSSSIKMKISNSDAFYKKFGKEAQEQFIQELITDRKGFFINASALLSKDRYEVIILETETGTTKDKLNSKAQAEPLFMTQNKKHIDFVKRTEFVSKLKNSTKAFDDLIAIDTHVKNTNVLFELVSFKKEATSLRPLSTIGINKRRNSFVPLVNEVWGEKSRVGFQLNNGIATRKFNQSIRIREILKVRRAFYEMSVSKQINAGVKSNPFFDLFEIDSLIKNSALLSYNENVFNSLSFATKTNNKSYLEQHQRYGHKTIKEIQLLNQEMFDKIMSEMTIDEDISGMVYGKNTTTGSDLVFKISERYGELFNFYSISGSGKPANNIFKMTSAIKNIKSFIENKWTFGKYGTKQISSFSHYETTSGTKNDKTAVRDAIVKTAKFNKKSFYNKSIYAYKNTAPSCYFDIGSFTVTERKNSIVFKNGFVSLHPIEVCSPETTIWLNKFNKDVQEGALIKANSLEKSLFDYEKSTLLFKQDKNMSISKKGKSAKKSKAGISPEKRFTWVYPERKEIPDLYQNLFVKKDRSSFLIKDMFSNIFRQRKEIRIEEDELFIKKVRYSFKELSNVFAYKDSDGVVLDLYSIGLDKIINSIPDIAKDIWLNKDKTGMNAQNGLDAKIRRRGFVLNKELQSTRSLRDTQLFRKMNGVLRNTILITEDNMDSVIKNNIPISFLNALTNKFDATIVPISKIRNQAYIDRITDSCCLIAKNISGIDREVMASVIDKPIAMPDSEMFFSKDSHKTYLDFKDSKVIKGKIKAVITKSESALSESHDIYKIFNASWGEKVRPYTWEDSGAIAFKKANTAIIHDELSQAIKDIKEIQYNKALFVETLPSLCYYDYDTWADRASVEMQIQQQEVAIRDRQSMQLINITPTAIKKRLGMYYDEALFSQRQLQDCKLLNEISELNRINKEMEILPNDLRNWAWVYETPDPLNGPTFGIDELLLPENDTRYKDFENIIFDKENMRPRNPVKELDNNSFIAKFPTKHPIPDYSEIGIEYIDVETEVMHEIFLKFYRIWQTKIFEFGSMTMTQSVKKILEYMYSWIMEYFPYDKLDQALRVFRLIRWYAETSIIRNSQYIITYEYGLLESKLNTGKCLIPNDLEENDSMYVDAKLCVIKNNPMYIGKYPASVTFTINNRKNTVFVFSLSNTVGSVNIYLNEELIDTVSKSALNLTYELPFNGEENIIKIEKTKENNLNGTFYIGNIKIPNGTFKDLNIEFDPTLKAGNKPLNEIAQKMMLYANLYENREEMYNIIRKGNLGVGEIYKRLEEYWKIHHQDKTKGKRLTIKEV